MPTFLRLLLTLLSAGPLLSPLRAAAIEAPDDPRLACDHAAARAERTWSLPAGLLAAIGTVESGLVDAGGIHRRPWPWSINAEGWSRAAASKTEAVSIVYALQARGLRYIDVGCFQVDLFYHPHAFRSLDDAFDPDANARAAAGILMQARLGSAGWEPAVAAYHSASLLRGGWYLQRVLAAWPAARARLAALDMASASLPNYAVLLSAEARLVRVVSPADPAPAALSGLPRVVSPMDVPTWSRLSETPMLPRVIAPPDPAPRSPRRL